MCIPPFLEFHVLTLSTRPRRRITKRRQSYARRRRLWKLLKSQHRKSKRRNSSVYERSSSSSSTKSKLRARRCPDPHRHLCPPKCRVGMYRVPPRHKAHHRPFTKSGLSQARQGRRTYTCPDSSTPSRPRKRPRRQQPGSMPPRSSNRVRGGGYARGTWIRRRHRRARRSTTSIWKLTDIMVTTIPRSSPKCTWIWATTSRRYSRRGLPNPSTGLVGWVFFFVVYLVSHSSGLIFSLYKMRQLVLAHSMSPTAPSTIQLLLTQPQFDANHATTFPLACTSLLDAVAASAGSYDPIARVVVDSLVQIVNTLLISVRVSQRFFSPPLCDHRLNVALAKASSFYP